MRDDAPPSSTKPPPASSVRMRTRRISRFFERIFTFTLPLYIFSSFPYRVFTLRPSFQIAIIQPVSWFCTHIRT